MKRRVWDFFCAGVVRLLIGVMGLAAGAGCFSMPVLAQEDEELPLYAAAAALIDAETGRVLYGKNADCPMAMASTTKIMTCILVLETVDLNDVLTVSSYAASMPKVKLYLRRGEEYTVRDLLYSLMLESHNDSAVALAEYVGKRYLGETLLEKATENYTVEESRQAVAAFAKQMNEKAVELGCEDTWFITPNGLDATQELTLQDGTVISREHCTTAAELGRIMAYCIGASPARNAFLEITRTQSYSFSANGRSFSCTNHNAFLGMMEGALSGKTGFTNKAGYCYVGALERDGRTFVVALLACGWPNNRTWKWKDARELMQYGLENYFFRSFSEPEVAFDERCLKPIPVRNGQTDKLGDAAYAAVTVEKGGNGDAGVGDVALGTDKGWKEGLLLRTDEEICVEYSVESVLEAPVEKGSRVGTVQYLVDGVVYRQEQLVTADGVERITPLWCAEEILERFLIR